MKIKYAITLLSIVLTAGMSVAQTVLDIRADKIGAGISPTMYGIFFEDINYGADGGLYAEMIKNRSFEFVNPLQGWKAFGDVEIKTDGPFENNPHYVRLRSMGHAHKVTGIENEGYFGVSVCKDADYRLSLWARAPKGGIGRLKIEIVDPTPDGYYEVLARQVVEVASSEWKKYTSVLRSQKTLEKGVMRLVLEWQNDGMVDVEHISLFPVETWKGHENGLRKDLAEALCDLKPGVFRFPGGCIVEGTAMDDRYQWKNTVGPVENRPTIVNRWQYSFPDRLAPDYYQSNGLGFYEYFLLAEEIGAEPVPVLNVGMVCQCQNGAYAHAPVDSLCRFVDDAVDLVEFANGDAAKTKWGRLRADMGHPAPFGLKYVALGNEQWGREYVDRMKPFVDRLRSVCPDIKIIGGSGPSSDGDEFDMLWREMDRMAVDLVDEHYYRDEKWFLGNASRYDGYDRKAPKVFAGEYACHGSGSYRSAICEAAFMTGLERNADVVLMATYAPLFANKKAWQWGPDLIWFDNSDISLTDSYEIQRLFSLNKGTNVVPVTMDGRPVAGQEGQNGLYACAVYDKVTDSYVIKVVNVGNESQDLRLDLEKLPAKSKIKDVSRIVFSKDESITGNRFKSSKTETDDVTGGMVVKGRNAELSVTLAPESFAIYRFSLSSRS